MKYSLVLGLGTSGISAAQLLNKEGKKVIIFEKEKDSSHIETAKYLSNLGIHIELGKDLDIQNFKPFIKKLNEIIIGPGITWDHPTLNSLRDSGIRIKGEMAIAWERLKLFPWIGITGTNGKTTVTHMLNHVLVTNGINAPMGGNVGEAATSLALTHLDENVAKPEWLIMELSSYQIEAAPLISPHIGIWTNLSPDHLERHKNMDNYRNIKKGLIERSKVKILNGDDKNIRLYKPTEGETIWISTKENSDSDFLPDLWIDKEGSVVKNGKILFHSSSLKMIGEHNLQNLLLVTAAALQTGLNANDIEKSLRTFNGIEHRLEKVGMINNMDVFNDSKATNFHAATMGINAVNTPTLVIAGGQLKSGGDHSTWIDKLIENSCGLILFGSSAYEIKDLVTESNFSKDIYCCKDLKSSINLALKISDSLKARSLLFSPACASFDQYKNYEERGNHFKELISSHLDNQ